MLYVQMFQFIGERPRLLRFMRQIPAKTSGLTELYQIGRSLFTPLSGQITKKIRQTITKLPNEMEKGISEGDCN